MNPRRCPSCGESNAYPGRILLPAEFRPDGYFAPNTTKSLGIRLSSFACCSCGHVWSSIGPGELKSSVQIHGREVAKQHLASMTAGPHHDLPDTPEAHRAADAVAEIDSLVVSGSLNATRRYHELSGRTWDQTHADVAGWMDMTRAAKLALFGWRSKDLILEELAQLRDHPMRDRELDG
jgi:hypothetical protein